MMVNMLAPLVLTVLLCSSASMTSGSDPASSCGTGWHRLGPRCFAFYPVWSSWSGAHALCSQTLGSLASLHTLEEVDFLRRISSSSVWLGGHQAKQNDSWLWSDQSPPTAADSTDHDRVCMELEPKSGELQSAPCEELRFYICSTSVGSMIPPDSRKPAQADIVPGVSLFDVLWSNSELLAEQIVSSSSFLRELASGRLTEQCYTSFIQQEALYLQRVGSTLQALTDRLQEADDMRSLLLDAVQDYSSRNQSLVPSPPPEWLRFPLQTFHSVALEEPIYWVVALSAPASLRNFVAVKLLPSEVRPEPEPRSWAAVRTLYGMWHRESVKEAKWTLRYKTMIEKHQDQMDVFKAINIFRTQMLAQKSLYKAVVCEEGK